MVLLAVDTSGKYGSIALAQCGPEDDCRVLEVVPLRGGTFSAQLVPQIAELLQKHGIGKHEIGAFAVASGPGSFTGLRVGLAAVKALAEALRRPIVAVSLLEAVAAIAKAEGGILAALDAGRGEVYAGECATGTFAASSERLLTKDEFLNAAKGLVVVTPDKSVADLASAARVSVREVERPHSGLIARLGWSKIRTGQTTLSEDLDANYIRRADAEILTKSGS